MKPRRFGGKRALPAALLLAAAGAGCQRGEVSPGEAVRSAWAPPAAACGAIGPATRGERRTPPRRIVSLLPSATELILTLGGGDRLVARTDYDADPALAHVPSVGGGLTPSLERLAMLHPELVVAWPDNLSRSVAARLAELGIPVYTPRSERLEDVFRTACDLGRLLALEAAADSLVTALGAELQAVRRVTRGRVPPEILYVVWFDPLTTAGPGTFISELIEIAGGRNVFGDAAARWPQVSLEEVVRRQPRVIVVPRGEVPPPSLPQLRAAPGWRDLRAVRDGRIVEVDADLFNHPGPRVAEAARRLATALHPVAGARESAR